MVIDFLKRGGKRDGIIFSEKNFEFNSLCTWIDMILVQVPLASFTVAFGRDVPDALQIAGKSVNISIAP